MSTVTLDTIELTQYPTLIYTAAIGNCLMEVPSNAGVTDPASGVYTRVVLDGMSSHAPTTGATESTFDAYNNGIGVTANEYGLNLDASAFQGGGAIPGGQGTGTDTLYLNTPSKTFS